MILSPQTACPFELACGDFDYVAYLIVEGDVWQLSAVKLFWKFLND
jgi:hypothetical protein